MPRKHLHIVRAPAIASMLLLPGCKLVQLLSDRARMFLRLQAPGVRLDMIVYNEAIGALHAPRGASLSPATLDVALQLLDEARAAGLRPSRVTYVYLFMLCERAGQGAAALQLAQARRALGRVGVGRVRPRCSWRRRAGPTEGL